jgi:hypothetical protein
MSGEFVSPEKGRKKNVQEIKALSVTEVEFIASKMIHKLHPKEADDEEK